MHHCIDALCIIFMISLDLIHTVICSLFNNAKRHLTVYSWSASSMVGV